MLFEQLKKDNMLALKNKNTAARGIYSIVINKCMLASVEKKVTNDILTDEDVLSIISKTVKELDDEIASFKQAGRFEQVEILLLQKKTIQNYLPSQLSEEEIQEEINKLEAQSFPSIMSYFKTNFAGKCDMKLVNTIARNLNRQKGE